MVGGELGQLGWRILGVGRQTGTLAGHGEYLGIGSPIERHRDAVITCRGSSIVVTTSGLAEDRVFGRLFWLGRIAARARERGGYIGILIRRRFFRPPLGFFSDPARRFFRGRIFFRPFFISASPKGRRFFRPCRPVPGSPFGSEPHVGAVVAAGHLDQASLGQLFHQPVGGIRLVGQQRQLGDDLPLADVEVGLPINLARLRPGRHLVKKREQHRLLSVEAPLQGTGLVDGDEVLHHVPPAV